MAVIFWVEDQSHWINKFKEILATTVFIDEPNLHESPANQVEIFKFAEAACEAIGRWKKDKPDIAILDANLNGNDMGGLTVSKALLKKWPSLPIIYLSEHSGTDIEQKAFEECDTRDFIAKHQANIEKVLCWRINAILRQNVQSQQQSSDVLKHGPLLIDLTTWEIYWNKQKLMNPKNPKRPLPPTPRKILRFLVEASPRPLNTLQIAEKLDADFQKFSYANYRQHIKTLRMSLDLAYGNQGEFLELCKKGKGIVTFGDEGAYCWKWEK